jgi:hypothetical protein
MTMAKKELTREYAVAIGSGRFPVDMLRYDACFPAEERESFQIETPCGLEGYTRPRAIILARYKEQPGSWTPERWMSFGWSIRTFGILFDARAHAREVVEALTPKRA